MYRNTKNYQLLQTFLCQAKATPIILPWKSNRTTRRSARRNSPATTREKGRQSKCHTHPLSKINKRMYQDNTSMYRSARINHASDQRSKDIRRKVLQTPTGITSKPNVRTRRCPLQKETTDKLIWDPRVRPHSGNRVYQDRPPTREGQTTSNANHHQIQTTAQDIPRLPRKAQTKAMYPRKGNRSKCKQHNIPPRRKRVRQNRTPMQRSGQGHRIINRTIQIRQLLIQTIRRGRFPQANQGTRQGHPRGEGAGWVANFHVPLHYKEWTIVSDLAGFG